MKLNKHTNKKERDDPHTLLCNLLNYNKRVHTKTKDIENNTHKQIKIYNFFLFFFLNYINIF